MINTSSEPGQNCSLAPLEPIAGEFSFFAANPETNATIGNANVPVNMAAGGVRSFVFLLRSDAPLAPTELPLRFGCENLGSAKVVDGLTTLLFSASNAPVADVVALAATASGNGVAELDSNGAGAFAVASVNVGAASTLVVTAESTNPLVPVDLSICPTDSSGACLQPVAAASTVAIDAGATPTFSIFAAASQPIALDPENTRIRVTFSDSGGAIRGATSVAVQRP